MTLVAAESCQVVVAAVFADRNSTAVAVEGAAGNSGCRTCTRPKWRPHWSKLWTSR